MHSIRILIGPRDEMVREINRILKSLQIRGRVNISHASPDVISRETSILVDEERMRELVRFTARTLQTDFPAPFGGLIVDTRTGEKLMMATNAAKRENDPSSHGELRTVRLACKKLKRLSLAGYTMYSTCEPCAMCMSSALWAGLDRVVYGATIEDASRFCRQIQIPAAEVSKRSDMPCVVDGPVLRELCLTLFTHPNMQKVFQAWNVHILKSKRKK